MNTIHLNSIIPSRIYAIGKAAADKEKSSPILMGVYVEFFSSDRNRALPYCSD